MIKPSMVYSVYSGVVLYGHHLSCLGNGLSLAAVYTAHTNSLLKTPPAARRANKLRRKTIYHPNNQNHYNKMYQFLHLKWIQ